MPCGENVAKFREGATWTCRSRSIWLGETNGAGIHPLDGLRKASWRGSEVTGLRTQFRKPSTERTLGRRGFPSRLAASGAGAHTARRSHIEASTLPPQSQSGLDRGTWPDQYLMSDHSPDDMGLSDLDGFLTEWSWDH
jgi:hypothetical protein